MQFKEILATLPTCDDISELLLTNEAGEECGRLANQPGTAGSVRVYHALLQKYGSLNAAAASEGLAIYAEHTADAREFPGKHPNIDRLLAIAEQGAPALQIKPLKA